MNTPSTTETNTEATEANTAATTGLALMAISGHIGLFFDPTTHSGFGFLTGGIMLAVSSTMILWKMTHTLKEINSRKLRV